MYLEIVKNRDTKEHFTPDADIGAQLTQAFSAQGILLRGGDCMNVMPPLCLTSGEIDDIISAMDEGFSQVSKNIAV